MRHRRAIGLAFLLVTVLVVMAPGAAPAASDDLTAEELCDLYPQEQGLTFSPNPGNQSCFADAGDCQLTASTATSCRSGIIKQFATAEEARANLHSGAAVAGLGGAAVENCDAWCTVEFTRGRFWVWWSVAPALGLGTARDLAGQVDQAIVRLGDQEPEEPPVEPVEPGDQPGGPEEGESGGLALSSGFVDVFVGTAGVEAIARDIRRTVDCRNMDGVEIREMIDTGRRSTFVQCQGVVSGRWLSDIDERWQRDYPDPTPRQRAGIDVYAGAVLLSGLVARDGSWMFPSIRTAMPLIQKLSDPAVARRFVEMVAARDMAFWEERGLG